MKRSAPGKAAPTKPGKKNVTLRDIANACDVSAMAVSLAINDKPGVSRKTAERIRKAIRELGYTPNMVAKSLRVSATNTLGVLMSDSSHLLFMRLLKSFGDAADAAGFSLIMANTDQKPDREKRAIDVLVNKRIDGLFLAAPMFADNTAIRSVLDRNIPVVTAMRTSDYPIDSVCTDNFSGSYAVVDYLIKSGSGKVHMINLPKSSQSGAERLRGYRQALLDNGLAYHPRSVLHVEPQIRNGYDAMRALLERAQKAESVFCGCDLIAIGAIDAALDANMKVPADVRICGFDDIEMLEHLAVPLTTYRQPIELMAKTGFDLLLERIKSPSIPPRRVVLPGELIIRKST